MAQYTFRATPSTEKLKDKDKKDGRLITEVVTTTTLDEIEPEPPSKGFRRATSTLLKKKRP